MVNGKRDLVFDWTVNILSFLIMASMLFVLIFIVCASMSDPKLVAMGKVFLWPKGLNFDAYKSLLAQSDIWIGYKNSLIYTLVGTAINIVLTMLTAYPLARRDFGGKWIITIFFMITMYFSGGMVPAFLQIKSMGLYDTMWALILPGALSVYNTIICRTYIQTSIPYEIQESAKIDGCSDFGVFLKIVFPLSGPILAVLVMYFALGHWNNYFSALIYMSSREKYPLQLFLNEILVQSQQTSINNMMSNEELIQAQRQADKAELLKYALVIVASLPFMVIYPLLQKYFVKGIMVGAIKG